MLMNLNGILKDAYENNYAVGAFNSYNLVTIQGVIEAAVEKEAPVIVAFGQKYLSNMDLETVAAIVKDLEKKVTVPVVLHLDHSDDFDVIKKAIAAGFTSVMYDGSRLPYEENVKNTKRVTDYAHGYGVSVEAELGSLSAGETSHEGLATDEEVLTDPDQALDFVQRTNVDALAVSIGTAHGDYTGTPDIRIPLLKEIDEKLQIPLVLHGGSGVPEEDILACLDHGITKMNVNTEISNYTIEKTRELLEEKSPHFSVLSLAQKDAVKEIVRKYIDFLRKK